MTTQGETAQYGGGPHGGTPTSYWLVRVSVTITGGPEATDVSFEHAAGPPTSAITLDVRDAAASTAPSPPCPVQDASSVRCSLFQDAPPAPAGLSTTYALDLQVDLGAGDDQFDDRGVFSSALGGFVTVDGGAGDDRITADGTVSGGEGADVIIGDGNLQGGPGDDTIRDNIPRTVSGLGFGGTIDGGPGDDVLKGNGDDYLSYANRTAPVAVDLAAGTGGEAGEHDSVTRPPRLGSGRVPAGRGWERRHRRAGWPGYDLGRSGGRCRVGRGRERHRGRIRRHGRAPGRTGQRRAGRLRR